ncbi:hypothetical protein [Cellulomonas sp. P5_C5]
MHLVHGEQHDELHDELLELGDNIATRGPNLLDLPRGTRVSSSTTNT